MDEHELMILLERIETKVELVAEGVAANATRHEQASIERHELKDAHEQTHLRLRAVETHLEGADNRMDEIQQDLRGMRHTTGLLYTIAQSHEHRILDVENGLRDLISNQS